MTRAAWKVLLPAGTKLAGHVLIFSIVHPGILLTIVASGRNDGVPGGGGFYQASCGRGSNLGCNSTKNLVCDLVVRQCVCATHPDPQFIYTYDSSSRFCVEAPALEWSAYSNCQYVIGRRAPTANSTPDSLDCSSNSECERALGQNSLCNLEKCVCECHEDSNVKYILRNGRCVIPRAYNESCVEQDEECVSEPNEHEHGPLVCDATTGRCTCEPRQVWKHAAKNCVLAARKCATDNQCNMANESERSYGPFAKCDDVAKECVCTDGALFHTRTESCVPLRKLGESCTQDLECEIGVGKNSFCSNKDADTGPQPSPIPTCQCNAGFHSDVVSKTCLVISLSAPDRPLEHDPGRRNSRMMLGSSSRAPVFVSAIVTLSILILPALIICGVCFARTLRLHRGVGMLDSAALVSMEQKFHNMCRIPEVTRLDFTIDYSRVLGAGKGGIVYEGKFGDSTVAVKTLNTNCRRLDMYMDFMDQEIEIFAYLPEHENIIKALAYAYGVDLAAGPDRFIIMELCSKGSMRDFLSKRMYVESREYISHSDVELELIRAAEECYTYTSRELFGFANQMALAAEFLAEHRVVHGDLACRNVLLDCNLVAKLIDFGLGRKLGDSSTYIKTTKELKPWKWSAPEVLVRDKFSTESDVWSFGVMLWEMFSQGQEPYPGLAFCHSFPRDLYQGFQRLPRPLIASMPLYRLMKKCWQSEPGDRIRFSELRQQLSGLMNANLSGLHLDPLSSQIGGDCDPETSVGPGADGYLQPHTYYQTIHTATRQ